MDYLYTKEEINLIKNEINLFVFDTNVWLDLYTLPKKCVDEILHGFSWHSGSIWLPNQVYMEFKNNYKENRGRNSFKFNLKNDINQIFKKMEDDIKIKFKQYDRREVIENPKIELVKLELIEEMEKIKDDKLNQITDIEKQIKKLDTYSEKNDSIEVYVEALRKESKTKGFKISELLKIYEEGELRYKYNISPGYSDKEKPNRIGNENFQSKYGDLVLWKEILKKIKEQNCNLIFIQNERKSDWWDTSLTKRKIPNILMEEFEEYREHDKNKFFMMDFNEFLYHFNSYFEIPAKTIEEISQKIKIIDNIKNYIIENRNHILKKSHYFDILDEYVKPVISKKIKEMGLIKELDKLVSIKFFNLQPFTCNFVKEHFSRRVIFEGNAETSCEIVVKENETSKYLIFKIDYNFDYIMEIFIMNLDVEIDFNTYSETLDIVKITEVNNFEFSRELLEDDPDYNYYIY